MLVLFCTRMASRCGAFSLSDGRFSSRYISSLAEMVSRYLGTSSWEHLARGCPYTLAYVII